MPDLSVFAEYLISTAAVSAYAAAACALKRRLRACAGHGGTAHGKDEAT